MDLKEKLVSSFLAFENNVDVEHSVHDIRTEAIKNFEAKGFPTKKEEAWKYTSLNTLQKIDFSIFPKKESILEYREVKKYFMHEIDTYKIVFVDGVYNSYLSETTHDGVDVCLMSSALSKPLYKPVIDVYFNKIASKDDSLTSLNTAFSKEGAYIYIPKNKVPKKPIEILHFSTGNEAALLLKPRNLTLAEKNSELRVLERHKSLTTNEVFTNPLTELYAGKNAMLVFYKVKTDMLTAPLLDNTFVDKQ